MEDLFLESDENVAITPNGHSPTELLKIEEDGKVGICEANDCEKKLVIQDGNVGIGTGGQDAPLKVNL